MLAVMISGFSAVFMAVYLAPSLRSTNLRSTCTTGSVRALTGLASALAGHRHAHLRDAWAADLHGDPTAEPPSASRRLGLAAGDVVAALRCRRDDAVTLAWRPVDALIASWHGSHLAILTPVAVAAGMIGSHDGFYGLLVNAENLMVIAIASYAAIKGLRRYRQISTPERPGRKASSEGAAHSRDR